MDHTFWLNLLQGTASLATAVAVGFAWWQIKATRDQAATDFEDALGREYREVAERIPVRALLGSTMTAEEVEEHLSSFYRYIDLTNEQVFLRATGRVRLSTWLSWRDGIEANLRRPAFKEAWRRIQERSDGSFEELRRLERADFRGDPKSWPSSPPRRTGGSTDGREIPGAGNSGA